MEKPAYGELGGPPSLEPSLSVSDVREEHHTRQVGVKVVYGPFLERNARNWSRDPIFSAVTPCVGSWDPIYPMLTRDVWRRGS